MDRLTARRLAKTLLKRSRLWDVAKHLLPIYHVPVLRLGLARTRAILNPSIDNAGKLAQAWVALAKIRIYEEDLASAIAHCGTAISTDPLCVDAYLQRGHAFLRQGRPQEALSDYRKALSLRPDRADIHMAIGYAQLPNTNVQTQLEEVARNYETALRLEPEKYSFHIQAGAVFRYAGQYSKAEDLWGRGMALQREQAKKRGLDKLGMRFLGDSWFYSFGHAAILDYYFKMGLLGLRPPQKTVLALHPSLKFPNRFLFDQWRPYVDVVTDPSTLGLSWEDVELLKDEFSGATFPDGTTRCWYLSAGALIQRQWESEKRPPLLALPEAEAQRGKACLGRLGLPQDAWYVCLHVREAGFWQHLDNQNPNTRDANIDTYLPAIRSITARGGWVIRMGDPSMKPLPPMEHVVDYAHSPSKSEWLDVFLLASCRFFLGLNSGPAFIPPIFGVPCALTNWSPIAIPSWYGKDIWIPKLFWSKKERRHLALDEISSAGLSHQDYRQQYESRGVALQDNTAEEINELVLEMLDRLAGGIVYTPEDEDRQARFAQLMEALGGHTGARLGRDFLRRNAWLLGSQRERQPA